MKVCKFTLPAVSSVSGAKPDILTRTLLYEVTVAQLVERHVEGVRAGGSSPSCDTIPLKRIQAMPAYKDHRSLKMKALDLPIMKMLVAAWHRVNQEQYNFTLAQLKAMPEVDKYHLCR